MTATIHKVVAGNGYQYYLRNVAAGDNDSRGRSSLSDYYSAHGESPGAWQGSGLASVDIVAGAEVTESQMKSLFGLGRHPNAEQIEDDVYDARLTIGDTPQAAHKAADKASRLGNPFRVYTPTSDYRKQCAKAYEAHNIAQGKPRTDRIADEVRAQIRSYVAFDMFTDEYERPPLDERELSGWIAKNSRPPTTAVAGFDITFSPVKSVSALWALAPRGISEKIEAAHHAAIGDALGWLQREGIFTRLGRNGVRQVDVEGIVAACFTHRDSRAGDPDLHTHVLIANRVRTVDGLWRTLDGATLHHVVVTVSEIYNTRLEHHLEDTVGVEFAPRPGTDPTKRPIREIVGIPLRLIEAWSRRETAIRARVGELSATFQHHHGREPIPSEVRDLAQQATLETRPTKHGLRSFAQQRSSWRAEAIALLGDREALARVVSTALNPLRAPRVTATGEWIAATADQVLEVVAEHRSTWRAANVRAEIERQIRGKIRSRDWEQVAAAVLTEALAPSRSIPRGDPDIAAQPDLARVPAALRRADGASVYRHAGSQIYTSTPVLAAEKALIELSVQAGARQLDRATVTAAVRDYNSANPDRPLNAGQAGVIEGFATSGLRVHTANAPAGSGKTTAMAVLTAAWNSSGGVVLGLAPTASAAAVLGESIGARCETVDKLLDVLTRHAPSANNPAPERDLPASLPQWVLDIDADTLVIVDEHVKLGTLKRLRLLQFLTDRGATIRCIGDDHQLPSIEAGGADTDMHTAAPEHTLTLTHVVRFASTAEASASLGLREGDPAALGWYLDNHRIHAGHVGATHDDTYTGWAADHLAGRDTIMLAANHEVVTALNERARVDRLAREGGVVGAEVMLADGLAASVGDTIRTRRNNPRLRLGDADWVRNGYVWTVETVHSDGSVTASLHGRTRASVRLPADYVPQFVRLGYAATIDSAQGITADSCHVALTGGETRQQLYVAMTRGVHTNDAYIPTALSGEEGSFWTEPAVYPRTAVETIVAILARDGAQKSAHTQLRDVLDPHRRLGRALDIYLDSLGVTAENTLGELGLARLDAAAEALVPNLTDSPAYPVLRQHLAILAASGRDPIHELHTAAAMHELDTAADPAAVLIWRLDPTGTHSAGTGPLPWTHGVPAGLDSDATQVAARARIVADLATQIRRDTQTWTPVTAPVWARPLLGTKGDVLAEVAVWRASLHIDDTDLRPTGPNRYAVLEREHQHRLDTRVEAALGDITRPIHHWADTIDRIEPRILTDPYWPVLADRIDLAALAGIDITHRLTEAAALRPLPDEMPAAALWSRLELEPSALDGDLNLRPDWITDLHNVLGHDLTDRVVNDPAWPRLVAAIDRATNTNWTPLQLLTTAHELLTAATPDDSTALRPDQIAAALAWRIDALLHHTPTTPTTENQPTTPRDEPHMTQQPTTETHEPEHPPDSEPSHAEVEFDEPMPPLEPEPDRNPETGHTDTIRTIAELFHSGHINAAVQRFREFDHHATDDQRWVITEVADTLYRNAFPVARARLHWAGERFPQHRALIDACTPAEDPHVYQPDTAPRRSSFDRSHPAPRDHTARLDRTLISDPLPDPIVRARRAEQEYQDTRAGVDDQPYARPDADEVRRLTGDPNQRRPGRERADDVDDRPTNPVAGRSYRRDEAKDLVPDGYALDYDKAGAARTRSLECVSCGIERRPIDATPIPPRRSDDGLCEDCREDNQPAIPDHDPTHHATARAQHLAATKPLPAVHAILRRDWQATPSLVYRARIEAWVRAHPLPDPATTVAPGYEPPVGDPLFAYTDGELEDRITELQQELALAATNAVIYSPSLPAPADHPDVDTVVARHMAAQDAIRAALAASDELHRAARAMYATRTELATHRERLDTTPTRKRTTRHTLRTRIDELIDEQATREREHTSARDTARLTRNNAVGYAGTPEHWDDVLATSPHQIETETRARQQGSNNLDTRTEAFIAETNTEIDRYRAEQHRRSDLTPAQRQYEHAVRHTTDDVDTATDTPLDEPQPWNDTAPDLGI
ncbi:relaxase domain-containing protein [Nocardia sp. NBC_01377]|uniref:MobF family relaxase n=1 Tax=Nocardia sp. NBC_01377 TaxID=2903595 RepID=UPI003250FFE3